MDTVIPVTESTLSSHYLAHYIQTTYQLPGIVSCRLFKTGINHLYIGSSETKKWVFRVYTFNWRTRREIEEEIRLLLHLVDNGLPVSYPIPDSKQSFIQSFHAPEGERLGVLFSFAPGEKISRFDANVSFEIGATIARMHQLTENFSLQRVSYSPETLLIDSLRKTKLFFTAPSEELRFVEQASEFLMKKLETHNTSKLRYGSVHLDIWFDNMHISKDNSIVLYDFDFCGNGWLCLDIAYYILQLYNTRESDELFSQKLESFLRAYESVVPISEEEKQVIPLLAVAVWFFYLGVQCERFDNWSNVFLSDDYLKRFIGIIKRWVDYKGITELQNLS